MDLRIDVVVLVLLVCAIQGLAVADNKVTWTLTDDGNGHVYQAMYVPGGITWSDAMAAAKSMPDIDGHPAHLVTITTPEENEFVYNLVSDDRYWVQDTRGPENYLGPWLGGYQPDGSREPDGGWTWVTGEPFSYKNWASGEPNDYGGESRLVFIGKGISKSPMWNDWLLDAKSKGYIVEWDTSRRYY